MASNSIVSKRLMQEVLMLERDGLPSGVTKLEPIAKNNLGVWQAEIKGPPATPYEGGRFELKIIFGSDYPLKPPKVTFQNKIYHMNVSHCGEICLNILKGDWSPAITTSSLMIAVIALLSDPNPEDPLVKTIAAEYTNNRREHDRKAAMFTRKYAA